VWWLASSSSSEDFVCRLWLFCGFGAAICFWVFGEGVSEKVVCVSCSMGRFFKLCGFSVVVVGFL
jgi:hypothetical protein